MNWILLQNSLFVATLATGLAVAFGFAAALCGACLAGRARDGLRLGALLALMMPPFLAVNCWLDLLGFTGSWRGWLPFDIYSLGGTVWVLALLLWPVTFLAVSGAWNRLQPAQLESDSALAGGRLANELLVPVAGPALTQATALTFVLALNQFAVPAILQTKVYPAEVWLRFNTLFDYAGATRMSWPLILAPLAVLLWLRGREIHWPSLEPAAAAKLIRRQLGGRWFWAVAAVSALLLGLSVGLPLLQLASSARTWVELPSALAAGRLAIGNTLFYAMVTATICVVLPLAGWRWRGAGVLWLGFLVPGVLSGVALIFVMNRPLFGHFYQSAGIVILAFTLRYLAVGWNLVARARRTVDRDLMDDARLNGAGRWQMLRHVNWPQIAPPAAAAWYLVYLLCLWDVEAIVLIVPPGGETLALRVFNLLHYGHNAQVNALCLTLLALAVLPLVLWRVGGSLVAAVAGRKRGGAVAGLLVLTGLLTGCAPLPDGAPVESKIFERVKIIGTRGTGLGQFNKPRSLAVDAQDNLYVADMTGRVQKFSPEGEFLSFWEMPQTDKGKPKGMCRDEAGNILVVEPHYSRVNHFNAEGKIVAQWGIDGTNAGQLAFPRAVMVNRKGEAYVSEYGRTERVQRFAERGTRFLNSFGQPGNGPGEFNRAEGLGLDAQGRVFVADSCNHRVQVFTPEGKFLRAFGRAGSGPGEMSYPYDVRVDSLGREYVCEFGNSRVQIFDAKGQLLEILGGAGGAPGQMNNPWAITLDSAGNLYVADAMNHRVQKFIARHPGEAREARAPSGKGFLQGMRAGGEWRGAQLANLVSVEGQRPGCIPAWATGPGSWFLDGRRAGGPVHFSARVMGRAYSPELPGGLYSWAVGRGWDAPGPLALLDGLLAFARCTQLRVPSLDVGYDVNETLSPALSLLEEGQGGRLGAPGRGELVENRWHDRGLLPLLATQERGEGRGGELPARMALVKGMTGSTPAATRNISGPVVSAAFDGNQAGARVTPALTTHPNPRRAA